MYKKKVFLRVMTMFREQGISIIKGIHLINYTFNI